MKKEMFTFCLSFLLVSFVFGQCNVKFGTSDGRFSFTDTESALTGIQTVTAGATEVLSLTTSHDIWNELTNDCSVVGGIDDVTITQILNTVPYDVYGGIPLNGDASYRMNVTQNTTGLSGTSTHGSLSSSKSSTGDVRGYSIEVTFARSWS